MLSRFRPGHAMVSSGFDQGAHPMCRAAGRSDPRGMRMRRVGWFLSAILAVLVALVASRYLRLDPADYFPDQREVYLSREGVLLAHVVGGMTALLIGPLQFSTWLRGRAVRLHRVTGLLYVAGAFAGGVAGLALASTAHGGAVPSVGFGTQAVLWLVTTGIGLRMVLAGRFADHRRWMLRSYALAFAAVTLRLLLGLHSGLEAVGFAVVDFTTAYQAIAWLAWLPQLLLVGWLTRKRPAEPARFQRPVGSVPSESR